MLNKRTAKPVADGNVHSESVIPYSGRAVFSIGIEEMSERDAISALGVTPAAVATTTNAVGSHPPLFTTIIES